MLKKILNVTNEREFGGEEQSTCVDHSHSESSRLKSTFLELAEWETNEE